MGLSEEDQKNAPVLKQQSNFETGMEKSTKESNQAIKISRDGNGTQSDTVGCCQGTGNASCCQNLSVVDKKVNNHINDGMTKTGEENGCKENRISGKGVCTRKACAMPTWFESWEREDTYAALAVVWAVASVAVAYTCYRQLS